jgi:alpha-amylase/alpha-mannosidase (GH57 family)
MQSTTLAIVWHMHQPCYRDIVTGESTMPWVRLHGIHSYYDMLRLYAAFPQIRATINFVPSLVDQLMAYVEQGKSDTFLDHTLIPAKDLTHQEKVFLLRHFFMANYEHKIEPFAPYQRLYKRLGQDPARVDHNQAVRFYSTQDYLDLQVYYNLVWFGFAARDEIPEISKMLAAGQHFTEEDKAFVIEAQRRILRNFLSELRRNASSSNVEIATTPYYHPIFPLLIDTDFAKRCMPKAHLPSRLCIPEIARAQLAKGLSAMEAWTGVRPTGLWPAEGSVCPEMIPMLAEQGVRWIATDDRVLSRSLSAEQRKISLHQPFRATHDGASVAVVFRDHGLSDLLSFTYHRLQPAAAVSDFMGHLTEIDRTAKGEKRLVTVILDGENPWEFYQDSGKPFLTELFRAFERENVPTTTVRDYLAVSPPTETLDHLYTGSWIDANFNIWIGKPQKNQAWSYIKRTIDEVGLASPEAAKSPEALQAFDSLCAACGSDWFWWYDDDFDSAFKADFDRIFRGHLKNYCLLLKKEVPLFLFEPIHRFEVPESSLIEPPGIIDPTIDGRETTFFEWANAVHIVVHGRSTGAMALTSNDPFETVSFGFNPRACFLCIEPVDRKSGFVLLEDEILTISIYSGGGQNRYSFETRAGMLQLKAMAAVDETTPADVRFAARDILELGIDFETLDLKAGDQATIAITLQRHGVEIRRYSHIHFTVPDSNYSMKMWYV